MPTSKLTVHDDSVPTSSLASFTAAETRLDPEFQQSAAQQGRYQRPTLTRVGQWQSVTLTITIPFNPGGTGVTYSGNG